MSNEDTIISFLESKNFSRAGIAGVLGTWHAESGFNPTARNAGSGAFGLAQWLGGRLAGLDTFANQTGGSPDNISTQLQFFWQEIQQPQYAGLLDELRIGKDPGKIAQDFVNQYERPGPGGDSSAPGFAQQWFASGAATGPIGGAIQSTVNTGNSILSIGSDFYNIASEFVNAFLLLFKPSFWLRVGAFIGGFILFILGINEFRHAV